MSVETARRVLFAESEAIAKAAERLNEEFSRAVDLLCASKGRAVLTGMGKSGFVAQKISATLSSTGTPSLFLHPAEAYHGDLGRVTQEDVVVAFSNSGETEEIVKLLPIIKRIGAKLIAVTARGESTLARDSDGVLYSWVDKEACPMGLAPTTSTTVMLALGDALAVALLERKDFQPKDFALYHPGGLLGKRLLLRVKDIMRPLSKTPRVEMSTPVKEALLRITQLREGSASVVDGKGRLVGIFTDGDLRRHLDDGGDLLAKEIRSVMTETPQTIQPERLAVEALELLRERKIDEIPVVNSERQLLGLLDVQDILDAGLV